MAVNSCVMEFERPAIPTTIARTTMVEIRVSSAEMTNPQVGAGPEIWSCRGHENLPEGRERNRNEGDQVEMRREFVSLLTGSSD